MTATIHTFGSSQPTRSHYVLTSTRDGGTRAQHTTIEFHRTFVALYGPRWASGRWSYEAPAGALVGPCDGGSYTGAGCEACVAAGAEASP